MIIRYFVQNILFQYLRYCSSEKTTVKQVDITLFKNQVPYYSKHATYLVIDYVCCLLKLPYDTKFWWENISSQVFLVPSFLPKSWYNYSQLAKLFFETEQLNVILKIDGQLASYPMQHSKKCQLLLLCNVSTSSRQPISSSDRHQLQD